jgi:hypothetical protein
VEQGASTNEHFAPLAFETRQTILFLSDLSRPFGKESTVSSEIAVPTATTQRPSAPWARLWLQLRVRARAQQLDRALAAGADPLDSDELALRAEQLTRPETRRRLAGTFSRLTDERESPIGLLPFDYGRVSANQAPLREIRERLSGESKLQVRGIAIASALVDDRFGPLYANGVGADLSRALDRILAALGR